MSTQVIGLRRRQLLSGQLKALLFLTLPGIALGQFTYTTNEATITITGYNGSGGNVTIPSVITGLPVTAIGQNAFYEHAGVHGATIPDSVTLIDRNAFFHCVSLTNVNLGTGVLEIRELAIPASTISIDVNSFQGSSGLAEINVATLNSVYSSLDGVLFNESQTTLVLYPEGKLVPNYAVPNLLHQSGRRVFSRPRARHSATDWRTSRVTLDFSKCPFGYCILPARNHRMGADV